MEDMMYVAKVTKGGPVVITGKLKVVLADGKEVIKEKEAAFCRCDQSKNMPFCDGSHLKSGFDK